MEVLWLLTVGLVPVLFAPPDFMLFLDVPKIAILRILTGLMALLWIAEWALKSNSTYESLLNIRKMPETFLGWMNRGPASWIVLSATLFVLIYGLSTLLSVSPSVSLWGANPGRDGYGFYNVASHYLLFIIIATHLKAPSQMWRLLFAIVASATVVALYGLLQHQSLDPFGLPYQTRIQSTIGNALFAASFLTITIPITLGAGLAYSLKKSSLWISAIWVFLAALQIAAIAFTLSRGPWLSVGIGLAAWLVLLWFAGTRGSLIRGLSMLGGGIVVAGIIILLPINPNITTAQTVSQLTSRTGNINVSLINGDGFSGRISIWKRSASVIKDRPWTDTEQRGPLPVRHLLGYGPEMFFYALPLKWSPSSHDAVNASAHSYPIQLFVEVGLLGMTAFVGLVAILIIGGGIWVIRNNRYLEGESCLIFMALFAALIGRSAEQMLGVARVSDMTMFWAVAALATALMLSLQHKTASADSRNAEARSPITKESILRWGVATATIAIMIPLVWQRNVPYLEAATLSTDAVEAYEGRELLQAIDLIDNAIKTAPDVELYYNLRADMLDIIRTRKHDEQVELASQQYFLKKSAYDTNPLSFSATASLAAAALKLGELGDEEKAQEAFGLYEILIQRLPGYQAVYADLATAYLIMGQMQEATAALDKYEAFTGGLIQPSPTSNYIRGLIHQEQGQLEEASVYLESFLAADLNTDQEKVYVTPAHQRLADIYSLLGIPDKRDFHTNTYKERKTREIRERGGTVLN